MYALVIPEVANLKEYALFRERYPPADQRELTVSGGGEAALRVLGALKARKLMGAVGSTACRVMTFGKVQWNKQQKARVEVYEASKDAGGLEVFLKCEQVFRPQPKRAKDGTPYLDYPQVPELVAENTLLRRKWWQGFSDFLSEKEVRDHVFGFGKGGLYNGERKGLASLVSGTEFEAEEESFVGACHEAWNRKLGALGQKAGESHRPFSDLVERETRLTQIAFSRCKNEATLRETLTGFWASAGPLPSLQSDWRRVLSLLNRDWRLAKDLALLALASYAPKKEKEAPLL